MTELQRMAIKDPLPNGSEKMSSIHQGRVQGHPVILTLNR